MTEFERSKITQQRFPSLFSLCTWKRDSLNLQLCSAIRNYTCRIKIFVSIRNYPALIEIEFWTKRTYQSCRQRARISNSTNSRKSYSRGWNGAISAARWSSSACPFCRTIGPSSFVKRVRRNESWTHGCGCSAGRVFDEQIVFRHSKFLRSIVGSRGRPIWTAEYDNVDLCSTAICTHSLTRMRTRLSWYECRFPKGCSVFPFHGNKAKLIDRTWPSNRSTTLRRN